MKFRRLWLSCLILLAIAALAGRMAWTVANTSVGWLPQVEHWRQLAATQVGLETTSLAQRDPPDQATFWIDKISQVPEVEDDPQLAMGAAWMLDAPQQDFIWNYPSEPLRNRGFGLASTWVESFDQAAIDALLDQHESLCGNERRRLIDNAIRLDSENPQRWRARALMAFQRNPITFDLVPKQEHWLSVLDECGRHDPDNALYDYLAALQLWTSSAKYDHDWTDGKIALDVWDPAAFELGNARFAAGLAKPRLMLDTGGHAATLAFLEAAGVSRTKQFDLAWSRSIEGRISERILYNLRWRSDACRHAEQEGNLDSAVPAVRSGLRISEQITEAGNSPNVAWLTTQCGNWSLANLERLHEEHPELFSDEEAASIEIELQQGRLDQKVLQETNRRLSAGIADGRDQFWTVFMLVTAQLFVIVALSLALLFGIVGQLAGTSGGERRRSLAWWWHLLTWIVALSASYFVFGMCPAGIVPRIVQRWLFVGVIGALSALAVIKSLQFVSTRFGIPLIQSASLAGVLALPLVAALHRHAVPDLGQWAVTALSPVILTLVLLAFFGFYVLLTAGAIAFVKNPAPTRSRKAIAAGALALLTATVAFIGYRMAAEMIERSQAENWFPAIAWEGTEALQMTPDQLRSSLGLGPWTWAVVQWQEYNGPRSGVLAAVVLLLIGNWLKHRRSIVFRNRSDSIPPPLTGVREHVRRIGRVIAASCLVCACLNLLIYLAIGPTLVVSAERHYRAQHRQFIPYMDWNSFNAIRSEIEADATLMDELRATIQE